MTIEEIRKEIDAADDEIAALYTKRMSLGKEIAALKNSEKLPLVNSSREKAILNRVTADMPDEIKLYAKLVFMTMFDTSKAYQSEFLSADSAVKRAIESALAEKNKFPSSAVVACQGVEGAYSYLAANKLFPLADAMYFRDWDAVFNAVEKGMCEYGVLPIENSSAGSVNAVYDLMRKHDCHIVRSVKLRITHCLLAPAGVKKENVKEIFSHEQAISQCGKLVKSLGDVKVTVCANTAGAAKTVAESGRRDAACIASRECADIYGLKILSADVQDSEDNYTRFIAISKKLKIFDGADKISVMVNLPHETGSLNKLLNRFSALGLNLTKIESRPIADTPFEFAFYFDFDADVNRNEVRNLLAELENGCERFVFLGSYKEIM
jgi:chorismate mutase/prephenate dehydratase